MTAKCRTVASVFVRTLIFSSEMHAQNQLSMKSNGFLGVRGASGGLGRPREAGSQEATFWEGADNP